LVIAVMYCVVRNSSSCHPASANQRNRRRPEGPQNGIPETASAGPGAWPTSIMRAPTVPEKTAPAVTEWPTSRHRVQLRMFIWSNSRASWRDMSSSYRRRRCLACLGFHSEHASGTRHCRLRLDDLLCCRRPPWAPWRAAVMRSAWVVPRSAGSVAWARHIRPAASEVVGGPLAVLRSTRFARRCPKSRIATKEVERPRGRMR